MLAYLNVACSLFIYSYAEKNLVNLLVCWSICISAFYFRGTWHAYTPCPPLAVLLWTDCCCHTPTQSYLYPSSQGNADMRAPPPPSPASVNPWSAPLLPSTAYSTYGQSTAPPLPIPACTHVVRLLLTCPSSSQPCLYPYSQTTADTYPLCPALPVSLQSDYC